MYYGEIKKCDIANGPGVRVSLFVSGCTHHCKGCFNEETWSFEYGKPFTEETEEQIKQRFGFSLKFISNIIDEQPLINEESYGKYQAEEVLDRWFDGSAKRLVSALGEKLTKEDGEELRGILDDFDFDDNHNKNI